MKEKREKFIQVIREKKNERDRYLVREEGESEREG